uniref:Phosphatidate cytidylyltransferase n=1 Tax=Mycena chlorophos TaxID=658473 RepID=A0ABQ0L9D1_MYCCL|nr:predicted protein [Mycena chlorophos]
MATPSQSPPPRRRTPRRASLSPARDGSVKVITRKVIRHLEGLGHLVEGDPDEEMEESEVAAALREDRKLGKLPEKVPVPKKIDWEIPRKVFHSSIGFLTTGLYLTPSISPRDVAVGLWAALAFIGPTDVVRLRNADVERLYERLLGFLMRESEKTGTNGTIWYILGVNFALTFYPIDVATVSILILSWADTAASTIGRMYGPRTAPLPTSISLDWLPTWVWVPGFLLAAPLPVLHANGNGNGYVKENPKAPKQARARRLKLPFAPRKSMAGFMAACITGSLVAFMFWVGIAGMGLRGVAEMRAVAEGAQDMNTLYHSQYSIAGQYLRTEAGAWVRKWVPEGVIGGLAGAHDPTAGAMTTPARFGVEGWLGLAAVTVFAGVVSGIAEALDLGGMDDNLTLPIISGGALMAFFRVWGWMVGV